MKTNLADLTVQVDADVAARYTEDWLWLIGTDKTVILVTTLGDLFLESKDQGVYWLEVGGGKFEKVATDIDEFERKLTDINNVNEWFMIDLTTELRLSGSKLNKDEVYSYKKLPIIGGDYTVDNFEPTNVEVHFSFAEQVHRKVKDLPDGTKVNITFEPNEKGHKGWLGWFKRRR